MENILNQFCKKVISLPGICLKNSMTKKVMYMSMICENVLKISKH